VDKGAWKEVGADLRERRCLPRWCLSQEQCYFPAVERFFSVADLSLMGMGFWSEERFSLFQVGILLKGVINLNRRKYPFEARIAHLGKNRVGCQWFEPSESLRLALQDFLHPQALGSSLRLMPSSEKDVLWYYGACGTLLILCHNALGRMNSFTFYAKDQFVSWEEGRGMSTGSTQCRNDPGEVWGIVRLEPFFLEFDASPVVEKLEVAKNVILSACLPESCKLVVASAFSEKRES
jgi:hypothetical protein